MSTTKIFQFTALAVIAGGMAFAAPAEAQYRQKISNSMAKCASGKGPAVKVTVTGIKAGGGKLRVQSYNGTRADWLEKGRWLNRIEASARTGSMTFCMPVPASGTYAIAVRHDINSNGKTDLREDGGAMSNNPSINIFNLGKPSYKKTAFAVSGGVKSITVKMKYL